MSNQSFFTDKTYARGDEAYVSATLALSAAEQAAADAADALTAVQAFDPDGITNTFFQTTAPTSGMSNGDMWIDSDGGNHLYRYVDKYGTTAHTNLIPVPNGNYTTAGWSGIRSTIAVDNTVLLDGQSSIRFVVNDVSSVGALAQRGQIIVPVTAGTTYTQSASLRSTTGSGITTYACQIVWRDASLATISFTTGPTFTATASDAWVRVFQTITAPAGAVTAVINWGPWIAAEIQVSDAFFVNGAMLEVGPTLNPAIAGGMDGVLWQGTAGNSNSVYTPGWIDVQDQTIATAILNAAGAQATADGKIRTFAQTSAPAMTNGSNIGDLWMDTDDNNKIYRWSGTAWVPLADARIDNSVSGVTTEYAVNSSETVAPTTGWSTAQPTRNPGTFVWYRVTIARTDGSSSTTNAALLTGNTGATGAAGTPAALISLTANAQVLAVPAGGGATTPATATVTGTATNTTITTWTYSVDGAAFSATVPAGVSRTTNTVTVTGSTMTARTIAIKADNGAGVSDTLTVAKVSDGATGATGSTGAAGTNGTNGADAYTVLLTNEAQVFPGTTSAAVAGSATTQVIAYKASTQQTATIGTITGQVTGLTTAITNNGTNTPTVTVTVTTALVTQSGTLTIPVTVGGIAFTKLFAWSVSYTGATGATGAPGANAAVVKLTTPAQVLTTPAGGGATTPATTTVTGTATNTTITVYDYSVDGAAFSTTVPTGASRTGNVVTITGSTMTARTIAVRMSDAGGVSDTLTVAKVSDGATGATGSTGGTGAAGADAYTVILSNEAQVFPGSTAAALAGSASSQVIAYKAAVQQAATIGTITGQVTGLTTALTNNGTTTAGFTVTVTTALVTQSGTLTVPITVGGVSFTKTFAWSVSYVGAAGANGTNATTVDLTATTQVLVSPAAGGATTPTTSTVTGTPTGTTISTWDYSVDSGAFSTTTPAGVSRATNVVTVTGSTMTAKTIAIRATAASGVADTLTVAKVTDGAAGAAGGTGAAGADAYTVILTNEAQVFPGSTSAALAGTATSSVIAYKGTVQQTATIGTITGQVTGLTTAITNNGTNNPTVTVTVTTALVTQSGTLTIPVTVAGITFTKLFAWSVSYTGATGATGSTGSTGATGVSVSSVTPYFQTVTTGSAAPAQPSASPPGGSWTTTEPTYTPNTELYRTERVIFSDASFSYTTVTKVSSYAAAVAAQATANGKNKVTYANAAPGATGNTAGDIWYQYNVPGSNQLDAMYIGQGGTTWQIQQLTNSTIATLDAAKITSGFLDVANRVKAGSIVAGQLSVGVMNTNLCSDPSFENVGVGTASPVSLAPYTSGTPSNNWRYGTSGAGTATIQAVTNRSRSGNWAASLSINSTPTITTGYLYSPTIPTVPGVTYKVSFYATRTSAEATLLLDGFYGATDTTVTTPFSITSDQDVFTQPTIQTVEPYDPALFDVYTYDFTAPASCNFITFRIQCYTQTAGASSILTIDDFSLLEKRAGGGSELTPAGLRLFDSEGLEVGAFVSNRPNYFTVFQNGIAVATINPNGAATFADMDIVDKDITLAGLPLLGRQADRFLNREFNESQGWDVGRDYTLEPIGVTEAVANGVIGHHADSAVPGTAITPAGGYVYLNQINVDLEMGRFYTFRTSPYLVLMSSGCVGGLFLYYTSDGTDPTLSSNILARCYHTGGGNYETFQISDRPVAGSSNQRDFRVLAVFRFLTGTGSLTPVGDPFYLSCYDEGYGYPMGTGKLINTTVQNAGSPPAPPASTKTYVTSWICNNSQTRRGTSGFGNNTVNPTTYTGSTTMLAGYYSGSNGNQYDFLEFTAANSTGGEVNKTISQALTGATLSKVEIYVKNISYPANAGGSGSMRFAATTFTALPAASAQAPPAVTYTANQAFTNGQGRWIQLPAAAVTAIKTSGGRVLLVGPGSSTSQYYYSKWNNHAASSGKPQIRLTYTK